MLPASYYDRCFATLRIRNVSLKEGQQKRRGESAAAATTMTCRTPTPTHTPAYIMLPQATRD